MGSSKFTILFSVHRPGQEMLHHHFNSALINYVLTITMFQIPRKLAGSSAGSAAWATNIGNEYGQVLMSVLTASEGQGLEEMVKGLQKLFRDTDVPALCLLYVVS